MPIPLNVKICRENIKTSVKSVSGAASVIKAAFRNLDADFFTLPGLLDTVSCNDKGEFVCGSNFVPQGICTASKYLLTTAYDHDDRLKSVIHVLDGVSGEYITTLVTNGKRHLGGICYDEFNRYIWFPEGKGVSGIPYSALSDMAVAAKKDPSVTAFYLEKYDRTFPTLNMASFLTWFDGLLWVGTYNKKGEDAIYGYKVDLNLKVLPVKYFMEAPKQAQGMLFYRKGDEVFMAVSSSCGVLPSVLRLYKPDFSAPKEIGKIYKQILKHRSYKALRLPHMLEEICVNRDFVDMVFESAAAYYRVTPPFCLTAVKVDRIVRLNLKKLFGI